MIDHRKHEKTFRNNQKIILRGLKLNKIAFKFNVDIVLLLKLK